MHVSTNKMVYWKETAMRVWSLNSTILAYMQLYPRKRISLIVDQLFICIYCTVLSYA